ncbi:N-acetyltransferase [Candidatus Dojkabacteria bacterium]|uniref:N-acetyltransferase n=1 Tax=Candidatus Dojkabacteria bacterium TaxID=2099670 RepID=A0A5C7J2Z4_9BACT|nr:MAG: N-acetyltransferase [Candidatus Dojkabacteria bacterium]
MIEFKYLVEVNKEDIVALMNHPKVRKHMPLSQGLFDDAAYDEFIVAKEKLWKQHGYGPCAFAADGKFIGWGGLQYEEGDADLALVLHPNYWGKGKTIYDLIINQAFNKMGLPSITALLPPSRTRIKVMSRLGFHPDGELTIAGQKFLRFRLNKSG